MAQLPSSEPFQSYGQPQTAPQLGYGGSTAVEPEQLSLSTPLTMASPPLPEAAARRARITSQGLGSVLGSTQEEILQSIQQGNEASLRKQAALQIDYNNRIGATEDLKNLASKTEGPLDPSTVNYLLNRKKKEDPDLVIEKNYTASTLSALNTAATSMGGTDWTDALQNIPAQVANTLEKANDFGTKRQFLQTWLENAETAEGQQSWPGRIADEAKSFSQLYPEFKLRGNSVSAFSTLGLSSNIKAQADTDFRLDNETFAKVVGPRLEKLIRDNPSLAKTYIQSYMGETDKDAFVGNTFSMLALPDLALGGSLAKNLAKKGLHYNQVNKAVRDVLKEAAKPNATATDIQAAAGDLAGSAVNEVAEQVVKQIQGQEVNASVNTMRSMTGNFVVDNMKFPETPRNREIGVRIRDEVAAQTGQIGPTILAMNKVNRTPLSTAARENLNAIEGVIKQEYRGPWGSLLNVDINKESWNAFTNTWDYKLHIGNGNGEYFRSAETAQNYARENGFGNAIIRQGTGDVASEAYETSMAAIKAARDKITDIKAQIETHSKVLKDATATLQQKKDVRSLVKTIKESSLANAEKELNRLELKLNATDNTKRLAQIREQITALRANKDAKKLFPEEHMLRIKTLEQEARALNYNLASSLDRNPVIKQQGVGFYIELTRPLDETMPVMRDLMIKNLQGQKRKEAISDATSGVSGWKNAIFGKYRSPEDTLSKIESTERKAAVYSQAVLEHLADNLGKYIEDVARGRRRFDDLGNAIPWYLSTPRYVAGIPYKLGKDLLGKALNKEIGERSLVQSRKRTFEEFERAVDYARRNKSPTGETGWFFQNLGELEDYYLRTFQRMPSYAESLAYFAKVELDEYNRVLTNIAVYRNKSRLGTMNHKIYAIDGASKTASPAFDGVQRQEFPGGEGNLFVLDNSSGKASKVYTLEGNHINNKQRELWKEQVKTGKLKVIEIWDPESRPLAGFGGVEQQRIRYVLTNAVDSEPISFNQVNRRGGGHFDYEYEHYLKQAIIRNENVGNKAIAHYEGDMSVMALSNRQMGKDIGEHMNRVRQLLKEGDVDGARAYSKNKLMMEFDGDDGIHSWFKPGRDEKGRPTPPRLNLDEDFHVVPKGKTVVGLDASLEQRILKSGAEFRNGTNSGSLARQFQVAYTKERDAYNLIAPDNVGTNVRPLYKYEPAKLADAMPTMQRALNRAIKSTFMDDYKMMATEHWLREAEPYLKTRGANTIEEIRSSPFYHFNNPVYREGTPREIEKNLEFNRYKIQQFVGIPSEFDTTIHSLTQHLADSAYSKGVSVAKIEGAESLLGTVTNIKSFKDTAIIPIWMLNRIHDPVTKLRSLAFNFKLGLFNLPQLLVQAQTHASIWAIAGRNGGAGTYASMLHTWSRFGDDAFLKHLDSYATKINFAGVKWKPGEFYEARKELAKTGFEHVSGEFAVLDDAFSHKFVKGDFDAFLSLGQQFFKEGERWTRYSAWYTAFKEYRTANPTGLITKEARAGILQRADLLTTNMSRASSSALHTGVLGLTTQFLSYQLRMMELFMGKRLGETVGERAMARMRLFGMYSALYGVPAAFGITGLPVSNDIRAAAIDHLGYYPGKTWYESLGMEGIPSMLTALITGEGDYKKGNFYNIGDRYGAQGFTQLREALRSDATWWKILGGAGVTTFVNTIMNMDGFTKAVLSFARQDTGDARFHLKTDDVIDAAKEMSSVNSAWRLNLALNTGKWYSKNEAFLMPVSPANAIFMSMTGLSPQEQDDLYTKGNILKNQEAINKYALNKFIQEIHRSIAAKQDNNKDQAHDYLRRAFAYLEAANYPMEKKMSAISIATKGWESRIDQADFKFYLENTPTNKTTQRRQTFKEIQRMKDERK